MEFKTIVIAFMMFSLFTFLSLNLVSQMGTLNEVDTSTIGGDAYSISQLNNSVEGLQGESESLRQRFEDSSEAGLNVETAIGVGQIFNDVVDFIFTPFDILGQILYNILGVPTIITSVVLAILVVSIIFGLWKLFKAGS